MTHISLHKVDQLVGTFVRSKKMPMASTVAIRLGERNVNYGAQNSVCLI